MNVPLTVLGASLAAGLACVSTPAAIAQTPQPLVRPTTQPATLDPASADVILDQLEAAGRNVQTLDTKVLYRIEDKLNLTDIVQHGWVRFKRADPHPMFLIHFDKRVVDGIILPRKEWWLFRDRWLWEIKAKSKTIIKREVLAPGEKVDFFDLERAPFPIPFGQRKAQILENFNVSVVGPQAGDPEDCDHLVCRPKEGARLTKEYRRLDFYVSRRIHLPLRIVAEDANGAKVTIADFPELIAKSLNIELPDSAFDQPKETRGFHIVSEKMRSSADSLGGA